MGMEWGRAGWGRSGMEMGGVGWDHLVVGEATGTPLDLEQLWKFPLDEEAGSGAMRGLDNVEVIQLPR